MALEDNTGMSKSYVTINGEKALIIGNVCMDMIMVDVTGINCKEGDEVIIFGTQPVSGKFCRKGKYHLL